MTFGWGVEAVVAHMRGMDSVDALWSGNIPVPGWASGVGSSFQIMAEGDDHMNTE